ncbi:MAG: hypothetical protein HYX59_15025 [Elusimicrobia bacterium]|nr:hypothetical protein [Elusimicrobiota bacterium]
MRQNEYKSKYRTFAGYLHDFSDPSDDATDDEIARRLRADWPVSDRIAILEKLILETERMLSEMDGEWQAFSETLNRRFANSQDAADWLAGVRRAWQEELSLLKRP